MNNIIAISIITFKESLRTRLLFSIFFMAVIFSLLNIYAGNLFSWDLGKVSVEFGLSATSVTGILLLLYQGMKIFVDDLDNHTIYLTLSRPVSYSQFVFGKFLGLCLLLFLVSIIFALSSAVSLAYFFKFYPIYIPPNFLWTTYIIAYFFNWLALLIVLSITLFWFAFARQPVVAIFLTFLSYIIGNTVYLIRHYIEISGPEDSAIKLFLFKCITWVFPNLSFFDLKTVAAYGLNYDPIRMVYIALYGISLIVILLFGAIFFFKRKELI